MKNNRKTVLALGMFDGVHAGHQKLVQTAKELSKKYSAECIIYTFKNHPDSLTKDVKIITSPEHKKQLLVDAGADSVYMDSFTFDTMNTSAEDFLVFLIKQFNPCGIVAGFNYSFGKDGKGKAGELEKFCKTNEIEAIIVDPVTIGNEVVSSTKIRSLIEEGNIHKAESMLKHTYSVCGDFTSDGTIYNISPEYILPNQGIFSGTFKDEFGDIQYGILHIENRSVIYCSILSGHDFSKLKNVWFTFTNEINREISSDIKTQCECTQGK